MKNKIKWFSNNKNTGYVEYKADGKIIICLSIDGTMQEFELKQKD